MCLWSFSQRNVNKMVALLFVWVCWNSHFNATVEQLVNKGHMNAGLCWEQLRNNTVWLISVCIVVLLALLWNCLVKLKEAPMTIMMKMLNFWTFTFLKCSRSDPQRRSYSQFKLWFTHSEWLLICFCFPKHVASRLLTDDNMPSCDCHEITGTYLKR